jgi:hypothetical protein
MVLKGVFSMNRLNTPRFSSRRIASILFFVALTLTCSLLASAQGKRPILGGYNEAAVDNAEVIEAAEFAVEEQGRKQEMTVTLVSIERAETQVVAGKNFRLCLKVKLSTEGEDEETEQMVKVVVNRNLQKVYSLTSWAEEECAGGETDGNQEE